MQQFLFVKIILFLELISTQLFASELSCGVYKVQGEVSKIKNTETKILLTKNLADLPIEIEILNPENEKNKLNPELTSAGSWIKAIIKILPKKNNETKLSAEFIQITRIPKDPFGMKASNTFTQKISSENCDSH